jgi:uncharacterized delta-60 repeat protein
MAASGDMDTTFGIGGRVSTDVSGADNLQQIRLDSKQRVLVLTNHAVYNSSGALICYATSVVVRYTPGGALDTSLNQTGKLPLNNCSVSGGFSIDGILPVADGKFIVIGEKDGGSGSASSFNVPFTAVRYNENGSVDSSFTKISGGFLSPYAGQTVGDIRTDALGRILISGSTWLKAYNGYNISVPAVARYLANGKVDSSFGNDSHNPGKMVLKQYNDYKYQYLALYHRMIVRSDGTIAIVGDMPLQSNWTNDWSKGGVLRLATNGAVIPYQTADGILTVDIGYHLNLTAASAFEDATRNLVLMSSDSSSLSSRSFSIVTRAINADTGAASETFLAPSPATLAQMSSDCFDGVCSASVSSGDAGAVLADSVGQFLYGGHTGDLNRWWDATINIVVYRILP